jgi:hypothetical protein
MASIACFTTSRIPSGTITGDELAVSGQVSMSSGFGANVTVEVSSEAGGTQRKTISLTGG